MVAGCRRKEWSLFWRGAWVRGDMDLGASSSRFDMILSNPGTDRCTIREAECTDVASSNDIAPHNGLPY